MAADASKNGPDDDFDPENFDLDSEFDDRIPWSFSYVLVCILLPCMAGCLSAFAWSAYTIYVRSQGWSLPMAGLGISIGSFGRMVTQQVVFRGGIWTCVIFAVVVFIQAGAIVALDLTVAIEGITFSLWSDSEAMVAQAQSTVLSVFTISYATAATLGGIVYDLAGWTGTSVFHLSLAVGQLLVLVIQPAIRDSFRTFLRGPATVEDEDAVQALADGVATSVVPSTPAKAKDESAKAKDEAAKPQTESLVVALPGEMQDVTAEDSEEQPAKTKDEAAKPQDEGLVVALPGELQDVTPRDSEARPSATASATLSPPPAATPRTSQTDVGRSSVLTSPLSPKRSVVTEASHGSRESDSSAVRRNLVFSNNLVRGRPHTSRAESHKSSTSTHSQELDARHSRVTTHTRRTHQSRVTSTSRRSRRSTNTAHTTMSKLSRFTRLTEAGENFQYNFGVTNGLRPHVAGANQQNQSDDESEDERPATPPDGDRPVMKRQKAIVAKKRLSRDMYVVAFLVALCSLNTNMSYGVEWCTFAIFFAEQHNWTSAAWAGVCQTSGDLAAALMMGLLKGGERPELDELEGCRWWWHAVTGQPYNLVLFCLAWVCLNGGLCLPSLPAAIASQVIMGTAYVYSIKAVTDMNLFYSLGESEIFMQLQVQCRNADALGALFSGYFSLLLYEVNPLFPYLLTAATSAVCALTILVGFCCRVGFGKDIETAEAQRSRRLGVKRVSTWKSQRKSKTTNAEE